MATEAAVRAEGRGHTGGHSHVPRMEIFPPRYDQATMLHLRP
jgi:hypothetical protein